MNTTPIDLFKVARHDRIVATYLSGWEHGNVEWLDCLRRIGQSLEAEYRDLAIRYELDAEIKRSTIISPGSGVNLPAPILGYTVLPIFAGNESILEQQQRLIAGIFTILQLLRNLKEIIYHRLSSSPPTFYVLPSEPWKNLKASSGQSENAIE